MANQVEEAPTEQDERKKPPPPSEPKKNGKVWPIVAVVLVILAAVGYYFWSITSERESTDDAQIDGHISPISPRVGGIVVDIKVTDNQEVKAGDVLFQIDPADYKVAVDQAAAELADAQAVAQAAQANVPVTSIGTSSNLSTAEAGVSETAAGLSLAQKNIGVAQSRVQSAQARLQEAQANETKANKDLERYRQLVDKEEISRQQFDAAVATAAAAHATVESNRALVAEAQQGVATAESQVQQARAQEARAQSGVRAASSAPQQMAVTRGQAASAVAKIQQKQAELEQAKLNLQYTTVKAPVAGVIGNKTVQLGQVVQPGQQTMALIRLDEIWVTANFKENQLRRIRPGQRVTFSADAVDREYRGHVDTVAAATGARFSLLPPENATGNYVKVVQRVPVKVLLDEPNQGYLLRPGMSVEVKVWLK